MSKLVLSKLARASKGGLIQVAQASAALQRSPAETSNLLARLQKRGWVKRVRRGTYYILPLEAGAGELVAMEDSWILAQALYAPCYIGGWSAAEHWGLTEQLFRSTFVVTAAPIRQRSQVILTSEFHLVQVPKSRLAGVTTVWRDRNRIPTSDPERTIADGLLTPQWVGGIRHLAEILTNYLQRENASLSKITESLARSNKGVAYKRLGYLLEQVAPSEANVISSCLEKRTSGVSKLDPSIKTRGSLSKRWGLWLNATINE